MLVTKKKGKSVCFTVIAAFLVFHFAAVCWAQGLSMQVNQGGDTATFTITGATPSTTVKVCLEAVGCVGDVDGDRIVTSQDSQLVTDNFGPCFTWASRLYDLDNDGFVNSADVDIVESNMGCSAPASTPIPGCSISADIDFTVATILDVPVDATGSGSLSLPIPGGYDATFYVQAVDIAGCAKTGLAVHRFVHSDTAAQPLSSLSTVTLSDFGAAIPNGHVQIDTADGTQTFSKDANGQIDGIVETTAGDTAVATLEQTACSFTAPDGITVVQGLALGAVETVGIENTENSTAYLRHFFQPVMAKVTVGDNNPMGMHVTAPFHGLWELFVPDPYSRIYAPFNAHLGLLLSDSQIGRYLNYYNVDLTLAETATNAVYIQPERQVNLGIGTGYGSGFIVRVITDAMEYGTNTPYVKILSLYQGPCSTSKPTVTVQSYDTKYLTLLVSGILPKAEHLILLSDIPFSSSYSAVSVNLPPVSMVKDDNPGARDFDVSDSTVRDFQTPDFGNRDVLYKISAIQDCDPPKPAAPTMSDTCTGGLPILYYLHDCVITGNYSSSTTCSPPTTHQGALKCGVPGQQTTKTIKVEWKGTVSIGFKAGGATGSVGEEISISEEDSDQYTFEDGNGCGQCIGWWIHVKMCLTTYAIKYHEYEWIFPVGWCNLCCTYVHSSCVAQTVISTTVCNRTCN